MSLAPQGRTGRSRQRAGGRDRLRGTCSGAGSAWLASPVLPVFGAAEAGAGTTDGGAALAPRTDGPERAAGQGTLPGPG